MKRSLVRSWSRTNFVGPTGEEALMTWYAGHIFAEPEPRVIDILSSTPPLAGHLYHVTGVDQQFEAKRQLGLPGKELLVVRELCPFASREADWHGDEAVPWEGRVAPFTIAPVIVGPAEIALLDPPAEALLPGDDSSVQSAVPSFPPIEFLRFLKWVSNSTGTVVSFYHCAMWGGTVEVEYSWVFGPDDVVYALVESDKVMEYRASGLQQREEDVLRLTLRHHDFDLPTTYFALHTRDFPWYKYKLPER